MYTDGQVGGLFSFITGVAGAVNKVGQTAINTATQVAQVKAAWKGVPYAYPSNVYAPGGTGERLEPDRALSSAEIRDLQTRLNSMGYASGTNDGIFGPKTSAGITAFQRANGLAVTGKATLHVHRAVQAGVGGSSAPASIAYSAPAYAASAAKPASFAAGMSPWLLPVALGGVGLLLLTRRKGR